MLKIAKRLIQAQYISSRPSYHSKISVFLLRWYIISLYNIHHHASYTIIDIVNIKRIYGTFPCHHCFPCHHLLLRFFFFLFFLIVILEKQPLTVWVLIIKLMQVLRKLLANIKQIVEVGDILTV